LGRFAGRHDPESIPHDDNVLGSGDTVAHVIMRPAGVSGRDFTAERGRIIPVPLRRRADNVETQPVRTGVLTPVEMTTDIDTGGPCSAAGVHLAWRLGMAETVGAVIGQVTGGRIRGALGVGPAGIPYTTARVCGGSGGACLTP